MCFLKPVVQFLCIFHSGVARILLQGGTGAWRMGSEIRGDKVIQKWKPSDVRSAKTNMAEVFATACHSNWWLRRSNFELTELGRKISTAIVWTAAKFTCIRKLQGARAQCPMPDDATGLSLVLQRLTWTRSFSNLAAYLTLFLQLRFCSFVNDLTIHDNRALVSTSTWCLCWIVSTQYKEIVKQPECPNVRN